MNIQKMMQQAQQMQKQISDLQARMEETEMDGSAGSGLVTVRINGKRQLLKVNIDTSLLKPEEKEVLEDLIIAAYSDAAGKIESNFSEQMDKLTGSLQMPPGMKLPF